MRTFLARGWSCVCATILLCSPCPGPDSALALAPSSDLDPIARRIQQRDRERQIREYIRTLPLSEGHAHFGGSIPAPVLWRLALKRDDIPEVVWDELSAKVGTVPMFRQKTVDLKSIVHEGKRVQADTSLAARAQQEQLDNLQKRFVHYTQYVPDKDKGLDDFIKVYLIAGTLSKGSYEIVKGIAKEIALKGYEDGLRLLELRASLAKGEKEGDLYQKMLERIEGIRDGLREAEQEIHVRLKPGEIGLETRIVMTAEKENSMQTILQQTYAFLDVLEDRPDIKEYVVGFDAANPEKKKVPTQFIPALEKIQEYNAKWAKEGQATLGLTYHVGEDFSDTSVESGLRHVQEVLEMGVRRIGHGLVLGVDVQQFLGTTCQEPASERIAQIYYDLRNKKFDPEGLVAVGLDIDEMALRKELSDFASKYPFVRVRVVPLVNAILHGDKLDENTQTQLYEALNVMRNTPGYDPVLIAYDKKAIEDLERRQDYVLNKVIEHDALIEVNPTSNVFIGPVASHGEHPLRRFLAHRYPPIKGKRWLAGKSPLVTINTDNAGVFGITIDEEIARICAAQDLGPEYINKFVFNGFRYRLSNFPLRYRDQIEASLGPDVEKELLGYPVVTTSVGDIQFSVPSDTAKHVIGKHQQGKPFPTVFVLPPELCVDGNNYADIEFVLYYFAFVVGNGLKVQLVATPEQVAAMRGYLGHSLFGIDFDSQAWKAMRRGWVGELAKARGLDPTDPKIRREVTVQEKSIRAAQDVLAVKDKQTGRTWTLDDFIRFVPFENGIARLGPVEIIRDEKEPTRFTVKDTAPGAPVEERQLNVDYATPYVQPEQIPLEKKEAVSEANRPRLGYTLLDRNNGFDTEGEVSSFVFWAGKKGILVDPSPAAVRKLKALGLTAQDIPYVILTHNHADHDRGLLKWLFQGQKVKLLTSYPVYLGFLEKARVLLGEDVQPYVDFQPLLDDVPVDIPTLGKEKATLTIRHAIHPIPTIGFKLQYEYQGQSYGIGFSGDTLYDSRDEGKLAEYAKALQAQGLTKRQIQKVMDTLRHFFWDKDGHLQPGLNAVLHEVEVRDRSKEGFIHTPLAALEELPGETRKAMTLYHSPKKNFPFPGYNDIQPMDTVTILPSDEQLIQEYRLQQVSLVGMFAGLPPQEKRRIFQAGKIRRFDPGQPLVKQGTCVSLTEPPNGIPPNIQQIIQDQTTGDFFIVLSGEVTVEKDGKPVGPPAGPGTSIGEWALETGEPRGATVKAGAHGVTVIAWTVRYYHEVIRNAHVRARVQKSHRGLPLMQQWRRAAGSNNIWKHMDVRVASDLLGRGMEVTVPAGQTVIRHGEPGEDFYIVMSGNLNVLDEQGAQFAALSEGDHFGEMALMEEGALRNATVVAQTDVQLLKIGKEDFTAMRRHWPHFHRALRRLAQQRREERAKILRGQPLVSSRQRELRAQLVSDDSQVRLSAAKELLARGDSAGQQVLSVIASTAKHFAVENNPFRSMREFAQANSKSRNNQPQPPHLTHETKALAAKAMEHTLTLLKKQYEDYGVDFPEESTRGINVPISAREFFYPSGANIFLPVDLSEGTGRDLALLIRRMVPSVNVIMVPPIQGAFVYQPGSDGKMSRFYARFGLFLDRHGQWRRGYFERPLPIHALWEPMGLDKVPEFQIPVLNSPGVHAIGRSKFQTKQALNAENISTPPYVYLDPGYKYSRDDLTTLVEKLTPHAKAGYVVKQSRGEGGHQVRLYGPGEKIPALLHIQRLHSAGVPALIEARTRSSTIKDPKGRRMDWNVRVLLTCDEHDSPIVADIVVRYAPYRRRKPVNVDMGADVVEWNTLADWMGWTASQRKKELEEIKQISVAAARAMDAAARITHHDASASGGYVGADLIMSEGGWQVLEMNTGKVGGISLLTDLRDKDHKMQTIGPLLEHLGRAAKHHRDRLGQAEGNLGTYPDLASEIGSVSPNFSLQQFAPTAQSLHDTAWIYTQCDDFSGSLPHLEAAIKLPDASANVWERYGNSLSKIGRRHEADKAYAKSQALILKQNPLGVYTLMDTAHGRTFHGRKDQAMKLAKKAAAIAPDNPEVWLFLAEQEHAAKKFNQARSHARRAIAIFRRDLRGASKTDPNLARAYNWMAYISLDIGQYRRTEAWAIKALRQDPSNEDARMYLAAAMRNLRQFSQARIHYRTLLRHYPEDAFYWKQMAKTFEKEGRYKHALNVIDRSPMFKKKTAEGLLLYAKYLSRLGQSEKALSYFKDGFKDNPDVAAEFYKEYGGLLFQAKNWAEADRVLSEACKKDKHDADNWWLLSLTQYRLNKIEPCVDTVVKMRKLFPEDPRALVFATFLTDLVGDSKMARKYFQAIPKAIARMSVSSLEKRYGLEFLVMYISMAAKMEPETRSGGVHESL